MSDIKKKIFDIIFEPEREDIKAEAPLSDVNEFQKEDKADEVKAVKRPNAKDVLYNKQEKDFVFINYSEVPRKETTEKDIENEPVYEMRENVSPIFGPIVQKERKKRGASEKDIQKAVVNKFDGEYTGVVLSPIYGYDTSKANDARKSLESVYEKNASIDDSLYLEEAFDIPEDMKETIKEAVEEAVIELTPKNEALLEEKEIHNVYEDVYQNSTEEEIEVEQEIEDIQTQDLDSLQNEEETAEIEVPAFKKGTSKATRSIYDTAPVQLFDFDELTGKDDKDLFDELIGDDD